MTSTALRKAPPRDVAINLRATADAKRLIDRAARIVGKSRSEFILDNARRGAEDVLLDQRLFLAAPAAFDSLAALLDKPPRPSKALKKLLAAKTPWRT